MELQIQNEKINIKKSLGTKRKVITIEKDFILPDSKPDIIEAQDENANAYICKKENMENKIKIEGGIVLRIAYLTSEGKSRVLVTEENFSEMLDMQGINENSYVTEKIEVIETSVKIINERKIHFKVDANCTLKASNKETVEFIREINQVHGLQTLNQTKQIESFIGHGESRISLKEKLEIQNLQENIEIIKIKPEIRNVENKMSYNNVLVKADCQINCLYMTEAGSVYITKKEVPMMGFLDIENVEDTDECNVDFSLKRISVEEKEITSGIDIELEFNAIGDVYKAQEINILNDLYCLNNNVEFNRQEVALESCQRNIVQTSTIKQKIVVEDINQIYDTEYSILRAEKVENRIEGEIRVKCIYSSFEKASINKKEETIKFTLALEQEVSEIKMEISNSRAMILPDSSIDIELNVDILSTSSNQENVNLINNIQVGEANNGDEYSMTIYFVKPGDSLWKIAKRFKSTVNEIANINEIENENMINIGDKLYIPRAI